MSKAGVKEQVAALVAGMPSTVPARPSRAEASLLADRLDALGDLLTSAGQAEEADIRRIEQLTSQSRVNQPEREEADACAARILDVERARDLALEWFERNYDRLESLLGPYGDDLVRIKDAFGLSEERSEMRAKLRRLQHVTHQTTRARVAGRARRRLASVLFALARTLRRLAGDQ